MDNDPIEDFLGSMKCKMYKLNKFYSIEKLNIAIEGYI